MKKLSELIREGSKLRSQCKTGVYFDGEASCALGAANEAFSGDITVTPRFWRCFSQALSTPMKGADLVLFGLIVNANDSHYCDVTREEIADFCEAVGF